MRKPPTILVVEDEAAIAELIRINLRHSGYEVVWAADGSAAQAALESQLPDLILLDWMLPGESGIALAKRWRADARTKATPIILLTARTGRRRRRLHQQTFFHQRAARTHPRRAAPQYPRA